MTGLKKFASGLLVGSGMCLAAVLPASAQGTEGTIYDPQIFKYMTVSPEQKAKIDKILAQSEKAMVKVFAKYRIDPKAKPVFDKLRAASADLQAVESWEKQQMKKVLTKEQYADYLEILQATAANVIKATRDD